MTQRDEPVTEESTGLPSRRSVLRGAAATGAVAAVAVVAAGCGGDDGGNGGAGGTTTPTATGGGQSTPAGPQALGKTSVVPVGGGHVFEAERVVVTQPQADQFKAFSAVCTHMGCTVNRVEDGLIKCPCHGSQYSIEDASVVGGPAPSPLPAKQISVEGDEIFVT